MRIKKVAALALAVLSLGGCVTVQTARTLTIPVAPGQKQVVVNSYAKVHCQELIIIFTCRPYLEVTEVK